MELSIKNFIDFSHTLMGMSEVKDSKFPLPKEMVFMLDEVNHVRLQLELHNEKNKGEEFVNNDEFVVSIFNIEFKFIKKSL